MISAYKAMAKEAYEAAHAGYPKIKMQQFQHSLLPAPKLCHKTVFAQHFNQWNWK